jgi:leucyl aminopeptidase
MKKDMGGAAHVLGLAQLMMSQNLPIQLRVLIPTVENAVSGEAYHPGDILTSRTSKTIEILNTDAEGRLILCDALAAAAEEKPELIIDFATLTGAAKIALGTEVAAFFTNDEALAQQVAESSQRVNDPCWRLPLYQPYRKLLDSNIADMANCSLGSYAGAITAALYLQEFVPPEQSWIHFDIMASNIKTAPGRPEGGEANGLRAMYEILKGKV